MATATDPKGTAMIFTTIFLLNCDFATGFAVAGDLHRAGLLTPTIRRSDIAGDIAGCVSGDAADGSGKFWVCVNDGSAARRIITEAVGLPVAHESQWKG